MQPRTWGRSGLQAAPLGFGAFKIGRNEKIKYPTAYDLPDEKTVAALLDGVLGLGITHLDTAPAYGLSEERIGRCLAHRRSEFVLSSKVGEVFENGESRYEFSRDAVRRSVEISLKRLRTDWLDLLLIHAPADDLRVLTDTPVVETIQELREAGLVRAIGFSGKTVPAAEHALAWADLLMVEYHLHDRSHAEVIRLAHQNGVGVLVKKGLAAGHLSPAEAIPFVLQTPGVSGLVIGGLSLDHLAANVQIAAGCS